MKKIFGIMGVVGLLFAGCSSEDDILSAYHNDPDAVHITAEVGKASADGFTRSNPLGAPDEQKQFNENDEISVTADGQEAVIYKLNKSEWEPQDGKFLKWESNEMNFTAYYPASYNGGTITQPTAYPDEASLIAADYMSFTDDVKNPGDNTLKLNMERQMARVVVEIVKFNNQYDQNTTVNSVTIKGVKAYKHSMDNKDKYYALIVPCEAQADQEFLSLNVGGDNTETLKGIPALDAGKSYTYQLTVGKNKVVVNGITVANWTEGTITDDGKATYTPYVTFTAAGEQKFKMTVNGGYTISGLEYSVNDGAWKKVVAGEEVKFGGDKGNLRLRGTNANGTASAWDKYSTINFTNINVNVACEGDIRTLLDYKTYKTVDTSNARFCSLFEDCTALTSAPDLPATTLAMECYDGMFRNCTSLESAPKLPATALADYCYNSMFYGCTNLTSAPELSATKLTKRCYCNMFNGCTNLSSVTMSAPSDQITVDRFTNWLNEAGIDPSVTTRTLIVKDEAAYDALVSKGYLPADYWQIGKCTILDETGFDLGIPYLTFTANAAQTFKMAITGSYAISGLQYSVNHGTWTDVEANKGVTFGGTHGTLRLRGTNTNGTASNWNDYSTITFDNTVNVSCTGDIRTLLDYKTYKTVDTSNARFCSLFEDCTALTSAPKLPATKLANSCYAKMFAKCTSLKSAPKLPATKLEGLCYSGMFCGCSKLSSVTMLAPSDQISGSPFNIWLLNAGTDATSRTLTLADDVAYNALVSSLPDIWKKDATNTTVEYYTPKP